MSMDTDQIIAIEKKVSAKEPAKRSTNRKSGQTLVEYALILAAVAITLIGILGILGDDLTNFFGEVVNELENAQEI